MVEISAVVPSYNHAAFIGEALRSVLDQTLPVREVIVVDDGSTDNTLERLSTIVDPRIKLIAFAKNRGACESLNAGIRAAASPLIAICNSDDIWERKKLEVQISALEQNDNVSAVFSNVTLIGEAGQDVTRLRPDLSKIFSQENRPRADWLRHLVENRNCLCHPSILVRRSVYDQIGFYDNRYRQLPDFQMWLRLLCRFSIHVVEDRLVRFRIHSSTSTPNKSNSTRDANEYADVILEFFQQLTTENFYLAFGSRREPHDPLFDLETEKIIYLWSINTGVGPTFRWVADQVAMALLKTERGLRAWEGYGLSMSDFHVLRGLVSPWLPNGRSSVLSSQESETIFRLFGGQHSDLTPSFDSPPHIRMPFSLRKLQREFRRVGRQFQELVKTLSGRG